jgi:hypothetical protein
MLILLLGLDREKTYFTIHSLTPSLLLACFGLITSLLIMRRMVRMFAIASNVYTI